MLQVLAAIAARGPERHRRLLQRPRRRAKLPNPSDCADRGSPPTPVAFAEARNGGDDTASRIAVRTSTDAGASWSAVAFAVGSLNTSAAFAACTKTNFTGCRASNPTAVWDSVSAKVVLAYVVRSFGPYPNDVGNGIVRSADGTTWDVPEDVSAGFVSDGHYGMPGPGTALQLDSGPKKGRLLVPVQHGYVTVSVSDDDGKTWRTKPATDRSGSPEESALTQLPNGSVMLNFRHKCSAPGQCWANHTLPGGSRRLERRRRHLRPRLVRCKIGGSDLPGLDRQLRRRHLLQQLGLEHQQEPPDDPKVHRQYGDVGEVAARPDGRV